MISLNQAEKLVKLARDSISGVLNGKEANVSSDVKEEFKDKLGAFVTLYVDDKLAGCIGFPEPTAPLWRAVKESALSAAFEDPRFIHIDIERYKRVRIEMSILTKPEEIKVNESSEYPSKVNVGKDGLVIRAGFRSGLLLPQVATEYGWDSEEFLSQTCIKAGLDKDYWKGIRKGVYKFQAQIFSEEKGILVEKKQ